MACARFTGVECRALAGEAGEWSEVREESLFWHVHVPRCVTPPGRHSTRAGEAGQWQREMRRRRARAGILTGESGRGVEDAGAMLEGLQPSLFFDKTARFQFHHV